MLRLDHTNIPLTYVAELLEELEQLPLAQVPDDLLWMTENFS